MALAPWALLWSFFGLTSSLGAQQLQLNQIQVKGTHNSYHQQGLIAWDASHKYSHLPLKDQLETRGIRAFELDVHQPALGSDLVVYHIAVIDSKTSCSKFKDCLGQLKAWSDRNPGHMSIFVWIEVKDATGGPKFKNFDRIDQEIRAVLGDRLITPDSVQKDSETLQAAVQLNGWPAVEESRGKFMFMLDQDDRTPTVYLIEGSLLGRAMFVRATPEHIDSPWAVVAKTSAGSFQKEAMGKNFILSDNVCGAGDKAEDCRSKLQEARNAGIQLLMDDLEGNDAKHSLDGYFVDLLEPFAVNCNPYNAPIGCESGNLQ